MNTAPKYDSAEFQEFLKWKEAQAAKQITEQSLTTVDVEPEVTPDQEMQRLTEMKLELVEKVGYSIPDPVQRTMLGIHTFTKCLAAYQETATAYRTNKPEDLLNIIAACAYNTTLHDRLVSPEACLAAKGKPPYRTMGALYDPNANELFRTEKIDEQKRGSQFVVMPNEQETINTSSKVCVGVIQIEFDGSGTVNWDQMPVEINHAKNDINSLQYELLLKHRDSIKKRAELMSKYAPKGTNKDDFKQFAFILAVASFFDIETFNLALKEVEVLADKLFNGDLKMFVDALSKIKEQFKSQGKLVIASHTIGELMDQHKIGKMSVQRLIRYLDRIDLQVGNIKYDGIPTQGLEIKVIESKLAELQQAA